MAKKNANLVRLALRTLMPTKPQDVVKVLRPDELDYICELCDVLASLRACDEAWYSDEDGENDAETDL